MHGRLHYLKSLQRVDAKQHVMDWVNRYYCPENAAPPSQISLYTPGHESLMVNQLFSIGTRSCCDLQLQSRNVSRIHVFLLPTCDGFYLVDIGSLNGTNLFFYDQSGAQQLVTLNQTQPFRFFKRGSFVILEICREHIFLNFKACFICDVAPSSRLPCGHACLCGGCSRKMHEKRCPLCRTEFGEMEDDVTGGCTYIHSMKHHK